MSSYADISDPEFDEIRDDVIQLASSLVGLCFYVRRKNMDGDPVKQLTCHFRSGFIMELVDRWFWVTAGHVLTAIEDWLKDTDLVVDDFRLLDHFGAGADHITHVPFDYRRAWKHFEWDDDLGLDYGFVELGLLEKACLEKNRIRVVRFGESGKEESNRCDWYLIIGIPEETIARDLKTIPGGFSLFGKPSPTFVYETELSDISEDEKAKPYRRLVCKLADIWDGSSIDGLSGGPVIGVTGPYYRVVAIQSGWLSQSLVTFACPLKGCLPRLLDALRKRFNTERK